MIMGKDLIKLGGTKMKLSELSNLVRVSGNLDPELYVAQIDLDEDGNLLDAQYYDISVEQWDQSNPDSHFTLIPKELVSG